MGTYRAPPDLLAGFKEASLRHGKEGRGLERRVSGEGRKEKGGEWEDKWRSCAPFSSNSLLTITGVIQYSGAQATVKSRS